MSNATAMVLQNEIGSLVRRARDGDQNAEGMIRAVFDRVKAGGPMTHALARAKAAHEMILSYIHEHPISPGFFSKFFHKSAPPTQVVTPPEPTAPPADITSTMGDDAVASLVHVADMAPVVDWSDNPENLFALCIVPNGGRDAIMACATMLADGPMLTNRKIDSIVDLVTDPQLRMAFVNGLTHGGKRSGSYLARTLSDDRKAMYDAGRSIGIARGIQAVRIGYPLAVLCDHVAYEHAQDG